LSEQAIVFKQVRALPDDDPALFDISLRRMTPKGPGAPHVLISFTAVDGATARPSIPPTELALDDVSRERLGELQASVQARSGRYSGRTSRPDVSPSVLSTNRRTSQQHRSTTRRARS
jgi:hypothetical protein